VAGEADSSVGGAPARQASVDGDYEDEDTPGGKAAKRDPVTFFAAAPERVQPGELFIAELWACVNAKRAEMKKQLGDQMRATKGPLSLVRGATITVRVTVPAGFEAEEESDSFLWAEDDSNASFALTCLEHSRTGNGASEQLP